MAVLANLKVESIGFRSPTANFGVIPPSRLKFSPCKHRSKAAPMKPAAVLAKLRKPPESPPHFDTPFMGGSLSFFEGAPVLVDC